MNNDTLKNTITQSVDVAIIGAGTAGQNVFAQVRQATENIVIINDGYWSTTCATVGCMPSKLLIAAAERAHHANDSAEFGIISQAKIDGKQVMKRVQSERDRFASFVNKKVDGWDSKYKISGKATITADGLIAVNDELIQAQYVVIATGSTPFIPEGWQDKLGKRLLTSDTVFELTDLPKSLAVVGAGAIGLELAQAFAHLGVSVSLFNRVRRVAGLDDKQVNDKAIDCLSKQFTMHFDSKISEVGVKCLDDDVDNTGDIGDTNQQANTQTAFIHYQNDKGESQYWQGDYVLVATGRRHQLKALGVENLGVELDEQQRPKQLNENTGQIADLHVYIVGDANAHLPLLHVASHEGENAGRLIKAQLQAQHSSQNYPQNYPQNSHQQSSQPDLLADMPAMAVVFSSPQIATVGQPLSQLQDSNQPHVIGEVSFDDQGRSRVMGVNCGLLRIYACPDSQRLLGASMVAPDAEYIAHILATAISSQLTVQQLLQAPFYHPTILEGLRTALRDLNKKIKNYQ